MRKHTETITRSPRRVLALVLAFCLLMALLPTLSFAADKPKPDAKPIGKPDSSARDGQADGRRFKAIAPAQDVPAEVSGDFEYELYEYWDGSKTVLGAAITEYLGNAASVIIPASLVGYPVVEIGEAAFEGRDMVSLTIPNGVVYIGSYAFGDCENLTNVTIPNSVIEIGWEAFAGTPWLDNQSDQDYVVVGGGVLIQYNGIGTDLVLPSNVRYIGNVFDGNSEITSVVLPEGITSIPAYAFADCLEMKSLTLPDSLIYIDDSAFSFCVSLESITIPANVEHIGNYAFKGCYQITSVVIPSGVTYIGWEAFAFCDELASVTIPVSVSYIGEGAFLDTPWFEGLTVPYVVVGDGVLIKFNGSGTTATVPDGVRHVSNAFAGNSTLTSVTLPEGVRSIGDLAFYECEALESFTFPSSIREIGWCAFEDCYSLQDAYFEGLPPELLEYEYQYEGDDNFYSDPVFSGMSSSFVLYYPAAYAAAWAPSGKTTWYSYSIAPYDFDVSITYGDANCDGKITAADAALILRFIVRLDPLIGRGLANADANGDAKITAADAAQILRFIVKLENKLGPK